MTLEDGVKYDCKGEVYARFGDSIPIKLFLKNKIGAKREHKKIH